MPGPKEYKVEDLSGVCNCDIILTLALLPRIESVCGRKRHYGSPRPAT